MSVNDTRNNVVANVIQSVVGSTDLAPEKARTYTTGVVFTGVRGLTASIDYFNINTRETIRTLTPQQTVNACTQSNFTSEVRQPHLQQSDRTHRPRPRVHAAAEPRAAEDQRHRRGSRLRHALGDGQLQLRALASY